MKCYVNTSIIFLCSYTDNYNKITTNIVKITLMSCEKDILYSLHDSDVIEYVVRP